MVTSGNKRSNTVLMQMVLIDEISSRPPIIYYQTIYLNLFICLFIDLFI